MSRFERIYTVACACCKADGANVPEVEAVIRLLLPRVQAAYEAILADIVDRGTDLLLDNDSLTDEALALLLAAYVTRSIRLAQAPLGHEVSTLVEEAAAKLAAEGATQSGLLPASSRAALATEQLQLQLEQLLERAVRQSVPTAAALARAGLGTFAPSEALAAARASLAGSLDVQRALLPLIDGWSYQTFNAGTVRAAADEGHNFIQLNAIRDGNTTQFCRLVDGRVVPMAQALAQLDRVAQAVASGDAVALASAAPFHPNPSQATQGDVDAAIARGGIAPFHHGCRTRNVPIRLPAN